MWSNPIQLAPNQIIGSCHEKMCCKVVIDRLWHSLLVEYETDMGIIGRAEVKDGIQGRRAILNAILGAV